MDTAYFTVDEVNAAADYIISELESDRDSLIALPIPNGISARERADLLDHHGQVAAEVRRRGWQVKTHVRTIPTGQVLAFELLGRDR